MKRASGKVGICRATSFDVETRLSTVPSFQDGGIAFRIYASIWGVCRYALSDHHYCVRGFPLSQFSYLLSSLIRSQKLLPGSNYFRFWLSPVNLQRASWKLTRLFNIFPQICTSNAIQSFWSFAFNYTNLIGETKYLLFEIVDRSMSNTYTVFQLWIWIFGSEARVWNSYGEECRANRSGRNATSRNDLANASRRGIDSPDSPGAVFCQRAKPREDRASGRAVRCKNLGRAERRISAWANGYYCLAPDWRSPHAKNLAFQLAYSLSWRKNRRKNTSIQDSLKKSIFPKTVQFFSIKLLSSFFLFSAGTILTHLHRSPLRKLSTLSWWLFYSLLVRLFVTGFGRGNRLRYFLSGFSDKARLARKEESR